MKRITPIFLQAYNSSDPLIPPRDYVKYLRGKLRKSARDGFLGTAKLDGYGTLAHREYLRGMYDAEIFATYKAATFMRGLNELRIDPKTGFPRQEEDFLRRASKFNKVFNVSYLQAEQVTALAWQNQARQWLRYRAEGATHDLEYITQADARVRPTHRPLHGITLSADDPFWNTYAPPNGYRCRCFLNSVPKSSMRRRGLGGRKELIPEPPPAFRRSPANSHRIFPEQHPYYAKTPKNANSRRLWGMYPPTDYHRALRNFEFAETLKERVNGNRMSGGFWASEEGAKKEVAQRFSKVGVGSLSKKSGYIHGADGYFSIVKAHTKKELVQRLLLTAGASVMIVYEGVVDEEIVTIAQTHPSRVKLIDKENNLIETQVPAVNNYFNE